MADSLHGRRTAMSSISLTIRPYSVADLSNVVALWHTCGLVVPANDPQTDIHLKEAFQPGLLVGRLEDTVVATVMVGYEGHRGWLNYLAVAPQYRRRGIGRQMVQAAEQRLKQMGCPKINIQIRTSNRDVIIFYRQLGFSEDDVISMGKRLVTD